MISPRGCYFEHGTFAQKPKMIGIPIGTNPGEDRVGREAGIRGGRKNVAE